MTKKTLPKAIRPGAVRAGTSDPDPRISEPLPEGASYSAARQASSVSAMDVTEIAAGERKARARKLVERFSLWSGVAGLLPVPARRPGCRRRGPAPDAASHIADFRHSVFEEPRQSDHGELCRDDDSGEHRAGSGQYDKGGSCCWNRDWRAHHAGVIRRCYLRDRHGFHRALCFGRDAA